MSQRGLRSGPSQTSDPLLASPGGRPSPRASPPWCPESALPPRRHIAARGATVGVPHHFLHTIQALLAPSTSNLLLAGVLAVAVCHDGWEGDFWAGGPGGAGMGGGSFLCGPGASLGDAVSWKSGGPGPTCLWGGGFGGPPCHHPELWACYRPSGSVARRCQGVSVAMATAWHPGLLVRLTRQGCGSLGPGGMVPRARLGISARPLGPDRRWGPGMGSEKPSGSQGPLQRVLGAQARSVRLGFWWELCMGWLLGTPTAR